jgi:2-phosphoglycerate kinase
VSPPRIVIVGGAPGAGKTALGNALALRLGVASLSMDDLYSAAVAVTTSESHPALHCMRRRPALEYYTNSSVEALIEDAVAQHAALWPAIVAVIQQHSTYAPPIVLDGWFVTPRQIADLGLTSVVALWIVVAPAELERRERQSGFTEGSANPERMLVNFLARSLWHNDRVDAEAQLLGQHRLLQDGALSVEDLCNEALERMGTGHDR